jgi:hypothetical protein
LVARGLVKEESYMDVYDWQNGHVTCKLMVGGSVSDVMECFFQCARGKTSGIEVVIYSLYGDDDCVVHNTAAGC